MPVKDWNVWVNLFSRSTAESIKKSDSVHILYVSICVQYFSPYVSADMNKMAQAFNTTVAALEDELTQLILEGLINARIDSHSKVMHTSLTMPVFRFLRKSPQVLICRQILYARDVDQRSTTFEKSLHMGKEFQRRAKAMILRAAVLRNQIHVKVKQNNPPVLPSLWVW